MVAALANIDSIIMRIGPRDSLFLDMSRLSSANANSTSVRDTEIMCEATVTETASAEVDASDPNHTIPRINNSIYSYLYI